MHEGGPASWIELNMFSDGASTCTRGDRKLPRPSSRRSRSVHVHEGGPPSVKNAVSQVNAALSKGLQETVKLKIDEIVSSLKVVSK